MTGTVSKCPGRTRKGKPCLFVAGEGTGHYGYGTCSRHGGSWVQSEEIWRLAMDLANTENITPTEALLRLVRSAYAHSVYSDAVVTRQLQKHQEAGGDVLDPPAGLRPWLKEARQANQAAARTAKSAVDAGVMMALAQRLDVEGALVADALTAALDALELEPEQRMRALGAAQERLMDTDGGTHDG